MISAANTRRHNGWSRGHRQAERPAEKTARTTHKVPGSIQPAHSPHVTPPMVQTPPTGLLLGALPQCTARPVPISTSSMHSGGSEPRAEMPD